MCWRSGECSSKDQHPSPLSSVTTQHGTSYTLLSDTWKIVFLPEVNEVLLKNLSGKKIKASLAWCETKEGLGTVVSEVGYYVLN